MANKDSELARLRAEVRKRRNAATAKISRIRRSAGIEIGDTQHDPRRNDVNINRYNKAQLTKYLGELNQFNSRDTKFIAGARGVPLSGAKWREHQQVHADYVRFVNNSESAINNIKLPGSDVTVGQRNATLKSKDVVSALGDAVRKPLSVVNYKPHNIASEESLAKLTDDLRKRMKPNYVSSKLKDQRQQLRKMLDIVGASEFQKQADRLSDHQFNVLWNYHNFAENVSTIYEMMIAMAADQKERFFGSVIETNSRDIGEQLDWAATLPQTPTNRATRRK